ncbi:hypothetical protein [Streptomyces sp. JHA26]|uniref:hypothetical protein n=1 Tax=Streptomyces sp. JHA26 TaxID=1917143 RepID=UPI00098AE862|nr:hypothetical protein [Streptomyces sp. JHA26]
MEQRIESSSQPLKGAGFDPAFIPGLTAPAPSGEPEETRPERTGVTGETAAEGAAPEEPGKEDAPAASGPEETAEPDEEAAEPDEEAVDGPVFEAADRRARIVADHKGVRLALDDQACEFRWDEIGAVETETARFGKRYTVTVHTPDRRWYPIEIEAPSRSRFKEWDAALDEVLDAYFDDGETDDELKPGGEPEPTAESKPAAESDAKPESGAEDGADDDADGAERRAAAATE